MNYSWGSKTAIATLQGRAASREPEAELWMGAHPKAPSSALNHGEWQPLDRLIKSAPKVTLGPEVHARHGRLPFLFKVLAAAEPLSLQAHPNMAQAKAGFAREDALGVPIAAPERNYRDDNHKPELICALTPFDALCGFRPALELHELFTQLGERALAPYAAPITALQGGQLSESEVLSRVFSSLMRAPKSQQVILVETITMALRSRDRASRFEPSFACAQALAERYPEDVGVVTSLMLNHVTLAPGEALFLPAGNLHAYLSGMGLELMANSDNVLRGGLTPKHVDVDELISVLEFKGQHVQKVLPESCGTRLWRYPTPAHEFELCKIELDAKPLSIPASNGPEILIATEGKAVYQTSQYFVELLAGESAFLKARKKAYKLTGPGTVYRAIVPALRA